MSKYPKFTVENFDEMIGRYYRGGKLRVPIPKTRQEFFDMTKSMYGVGLGVSNYGIFSYKIEARESVYAKLPLPRLWDRKFSQYDGLKKLLEIPFNRLSCGGVAYSHYGQFHSKGYRHKLRLRKFWQSRFVPSEDIAIE